MWEKLVLFPYCLQISLVRKEPHVKKLLSHWLVVISTHDHAPVRTLGSLRKELQGPGHVPEARMWVEV